MEQGTAGTGAAVAGGEHNGGPLPQRLPAADWLRARGVPERSTRHTAALGWRADIGARVKPVRPRLQRGVIILPSALTVGNLFFGIWAIVSAARGDFERAAWLIVIAGILDTLDGRVARATQTGSRFGEELDSLVDAISFGVAPALSMYFLF